MSSTPGYETVMTAFLSPPVSFFDAETSMRRAFRVLTSSQSASVTADTDFSEAAFATSYTIFCISPSEERASSYEDRLTAGSLSRSSCTHASATRAAAAAAIYFTILFILLIIICYGLPDLAESTVHDIIVSVRISGSHNH